GDAQARNVHGCAIIPVAIVRAVFTAEPPAPLHILRTIRRITVGLRRRATARTRVAGAARIFGMEAQPDEATLVSEESPYLPANSRVVPIVAPAPPHATAPPGGLERFQGLH